MGGGLTAGKNMMTGTTRTSEYDRYADEYAAYVATREQDGPEHDQFGILPHMLGLLGDVAGQDVLDAGCGEGYLARILAGRGARVTGIDLSPRLVGLAGTKAAYGAITYRVGDLSAAIRSSRALRGRGELLRAERRRRSSWVRTDSGGRAEAGWPRRARVQQPVRLRHAQGHGTAHSRRGSLTRAAYPAWGCRSRSTIARCRSTWTRSWTRACV